MIARRFKFKLNLVSFINVLGVLGIVYLLVVLGETVNTNYKLNRQAEQLQAQTSLLQAQKDELNYDIQYYQTNSYRERQARSQLGLQLPGETEIVLPNSMSSAAPTPENPTKPAKPKSNLQQWLDFLGGNS